MPRTGKVLKFCSAGARLLALVAMPALASADGSADLLWPIMTTSIYFSASPEIGQAPLGVQFYATIGNQYSIDFGDGNTGFLRSPCDEAAAAHRPDGAGEGVCPPPGVYHTYAAPGRYRAILSLVTTCPQGPSCATPVGTVTIIVT